MIRASVLSQLLSRAFLVFSGACRGRNDRHAILLALTCVLTQLPSHALGFHWPFHHRAKTATVPRLRGYVATTSSRDPFERAFDAAVTRAQAKDGSYRRYKLAADQFDTKHRRVTARLADTLDYTLMYRGISPSSEAGDIILGEKYKVKSYASARYMQQKVGDQLSLRVSTLTLQMAMDAGRPNMGADANRSTAFANLVKLTGPAVAHDLWRAVHTDAPLEQAAAEASSWGAIELQALTREATAVAARNDPIIDDIRADLHRFSTHRKGVEAAHKTVRVTLSAVSLCPSVVGPAAQATLFGYLALTGGPEQAKLLKELYLDKRLSSRAQLLSEEAHLAFESYQMAAITHNAALSRCAGRLITRLTDPSTARSLLSRAGGTT